jgi:hypothetical protein
MLTCPIGAKVSPPRGQHRVLSVYYSRAQRRPSALHVQMRDKSASNLFRIRMTPRVLFPFSPLFYCIFSCFVPADLWP